MKVAVDTNVLVRAVVRDDPAQADVAAAVLTDAELIAVALLVWNVIDSPPVSDACDALSTAMRAISAERPT